MNTLSHFQVVYPEDIVHLNDDDDDNDDIIWEDSLDDSHSEKRRGRKPKDWRKAKLVDEGDDVDVEILVSLHWCYMKVSYNISHRESVIVYIYHITTRYILVFRFYNGS